MKQMMRVLMVDVLVEGQSAAGNFWSKQLVVFETTDDRARKLAIGFFGDTHTAQSKAMKPGEQYVVDWYPNCEEYNGKWYTRLRASSAVPVPTQMTLPTATPVAESQA